MEEKQILIVDDSHFNIIAMKSILTRRLAIDANRLCASALKGRDALKKVADNVEMRYGRDTSYKLILMDCNMPFLDGYESADRIKHFLYSRSIEHPIIVTVTGQTEDMFVKQCLDSGK
jgi:CheY-like chemotaxis protein